MKKIFVALCMMLLVFANIPIAFASLDADNDNNLIELNDDSAFAPGGISLGCSADYIEQVYGPPLTKNTIAGIVLIIS